MPWFMNMSGCGSEYSIMTRWSFSEESSAIERIACTRWSLCALVFWRAISHCVGEERGKYVEDEFAVRETGTVKAENLLRGETALHQQELARDFAVVGRVQNDARLQRVLLRRTLFLSQFGGVVILIGTAGELTGEDDIGIVGVLE